MRSQPVAIVAKRLDHQLLADCTYLCAASPVGFGINFTRFRCYRAQKNAWRTPRAR